jgi:DNA end-binding protein Ku
MAARSIASLTLSFGLVSIPVKLYSATSPSAGVSFNLLHKDCGSRLKQQYTCQKEGVVVERADMVKGYEFTKDQYVIFTPEELKQLEEHGTHSIDIMAFVPAASIDPIYYDKAYYLAPDKGGARPYALLSEGMRKTGRCALARWASRGKQHIVQVRASDDGLILQQLLYAEEVRSMSELEIEKAEVKQAELELALQLINQSATDTYDPAAYHDEVKQRVEAAVQEKVEGKQVTLAPEAQSAGAQVIDLMEALRASLGKTPAAAPAAEAKAAERKPPKRVASGEAAPAAKVKAKK